MSSTQGSEGGLYCSTSGTYFTDKESLAEHYKSEFHRYNLKRKVAGLPPVTRDWFEARKDQLTSAAAGGAVQKVWYDPLTGKRFNSENTYTAAVSSKKYQDLVKRSGQPAPAAVVSVRLVNPTAQSAVQPQSAKVSSQGYTMKPAIRQPPPSRVREVDQAADTSSAGEASDWETASDDDDEDADIPQPSTASPMDTNSAAPAGATANGNAEGGKEKEEEEKWEEWDVRRSLFDNHVSSSFEANLEYMYKRFGFYLPDAEYLVDPQGLLQYLGTKLQYGHVPLSARGDDANARQFASLHAVQRHMVDSNRCKLAWEDNEDEYEDFYDFSKGHEDEENPEGKELVMSGDAAPEASLGAGGYELMLGGDEGTRGSSAGGKVLGSREFARYYRQKHRTMDMRDSVAINAVIAKYRSLGVATQDQGVDAEAKRAQKQKRRGERLALNTAMRGNVNRNLPRNVPY